jgi:predicted thioesterase
MPVGSTIRVRVSVKAAVRRQLTFSVEVVDEANPELQVARGTHSRVYINSDAFDAALIAKAGEKGVRVGLTGTSTHFVDERHTASREVFGGTRSIEALATSSLMNWAEEAAIAAVEEHLPRGSTTVGGETSLAHVAPTAKGMQVTCRALLARISPSRSGSLRLLFEVTGEDRGGPVMTGTHLRFLVNRDAFEQRARGVLMPDGRRRGSWAGPLPPRAQPAPQKPVAPGSPPPPEGPPRGARPPQPPQQNAAAAQPPAAKPAAKPALPRLLAGMEPGLF